MQHRTLLTICLLALLALLCGCGQAAEETSVVAAVEAATPTPTVAVVVASIATPAVTPEPTLTPAPTPAPTAEPRPTAYLGEAERQALMLDVTNLRLVAMSGKTIALYAEPSKNAASVSLSNENTDPARSELVVLGEVTAEDGTLFYHVRAAFSDATGYVLAEKTRTSVLAEEQVSGFGLLARPGCAIYRSWSFDSAILAQESYHAVRVLGSYRNFYYVVTQNGVSGFVEPAQVQMLDRQRVESYLADGQIPDSAETFSLTAFTDAVEGMAGGQAASSEALIVEQLTRGGLFFSPGYYTYFQKRFTDDSLYPQGFYLDAVYNSLLFKLWNSAGDQVTYQGHETEWMHIADYAQALRGDLLFFTQYTNKDDAFIKNYEVVFQGRFSGYVTACGVYLGNDRMLTVNNGTVEIVENLSATALFSYFDSGRRILSEVMDERTHLIEKLISAIYDRLGTPYVLNSYDDIRTGDSQYDCSGIVCWAWRGAGITTNNRNTGVRMDAFTASAIANLKRLYLDGKTIDLSLVNETPQVRDDITQLQRGDLIFLLNSRKSRISHIMMYLGDGHVIHSTTITSKYRGTLVSRFREELQRLYYVALRMDSIQ